MKLPLLLALLPLAAQAQTQLSGRVLDAQTGQPVPYASLTVPGTPQGTTANAGGEFVLAVHQLPAKVLASSLSYGRDSATVAQPSGPALTLRLAPAPIQLPGAEPPSYAAQLLMRAYRQVQRTRQQAEYGQAFYRQITRNGDAATEVLEAVWDVKASSAGVEGTRLAQGRYATGPALVHLANFSLYTKVVGGFCGIVAADTTDSHAVVSTDPDKYFVLHYRGVAQSGPYRLAEVAYESKPGIPAVQGNVYIDLGSFQVLHARATRQAELHPSTPKASFSASTTTVEVDFKPTPTGAQPNYVRASTALVASYQGKPDMPAQAESLAYFYDLRPVPTGLPYVAPDASGSTDFKSDLAAIRQKAYDPAYWRDNPVVKRTPLEEEVMRSFESKKAFGTMLKK